MTQHESNMTRAERAAAKHKQRRERMVQAEEKRRRRREDADYDPDENYVPFTRPPKLILPPDAPIAWARDGGDGVAGAHWSGPACAGIRPSWVRRGAW